MPGMRRKNDDTQMGMARWDAFQLDLFRRMKDAAESAPDAGSRLALMAGPLHCLLDLSEIAGVMRTRPITSVPLVQDWFLGMLYVRGALTGIVDYAAYAGQESIVLSPDARLVFPHDWRRTHCCLVVSHVSGIVSVSRMQPHPLPPGVPGAVHGYVDEDGQVWSELSWDALKADARFQQVDISTRQHPRAQGGST